MSQLVIEQCPETGIASILREGGAKVDLMPGEVADLRAQKGDAEGLRAVIANADDAFAASLTSAELAQIGLTFGKAACACSCSGRCSV